MKSNSVVKPNQAQIYLSFSSEFNNKVFSVYIPQKTNVIARDEFLRDEKLHPLLVYFPTSPEDMVFANKTCSQLLNLTVDKLMKYKTNDRNIIDMFFLTDNYIREMQSTILEGDPTIINYMKKTLLFRELLYAEFTRLIHRSKWSKQRLFSEIPKSEHIVTLLNNRSNPEFDKKPWNYFKYVPIPPYVLKCLFIQHKDQSPTNAKTDIDKRIDVLKEKYHMTTMSTAKVTTSDDGYEFFNGIV